MRSWQKQPGEARKIGVLLFDRFSNHCLANAIEPLRAANTLLGREAYGWRFLSMDGAAVASSSGLEVAVQGALREAQGGDMLLVISSYGFRGLVSPAALRALRAAEQRFAVVVGLDTGSWLLAAAGLLDGHPATIHWEELDGFREAFPEVAALRERVVMEGARWSCGGAMTAYDLAERLIARDHGEALRLEVAALFMADGAPADPVKGLARPASGVVSAALAVMREHLEEPMSVPAVAGAVGVAARRLEALFRRELGAGPQVVYRRLRLLAARRYVEQTGLSVAEIALRSGYRDASAMTRAFRAEFGVTPREIRRGTGVPIFSD